MAALDVTTGHAAACWACRWNAGRAAEVMAIAHGDAAVAAVLLEARDILFHVSRHVHWLRVHPLAERPTPEARLAYWLDESVCRCSACGAGRRRARRALELARGERRLAVGLLEARHVEQGALSAFAEARRHVRRVRVDREHPRR